MHVEMNIGLTVDGGPNEPGDAMSRAVLAIRLLSESMAFWRVRSYIHRAEYMGPSGMRSEPTLVVRAAVRSLHGEVLAVMDAAERVADRLQQDCVAVLLVGDDGFTGDGYTGMLVGPRAHEWGAFDPAKFTRFAPVAPAIEREAA